MSSANADRPTLLLVGTGEPMQDALRVALDRHQMDVEACDIDEVIDAVTVSAPDLVLLLGSAATDGGHQVLRLLAQNPATSVVPVALLADDRSLEHRLRAFRSGAVAVIERTASADAMARRVVEVARELPERPGEASGELGEATLDELVKLVSNELRSGILSVEAQGQREDAVRVVLGAGGPVAEALQDFVQKLRPLIAKAEPLHYEFHEASGGRLGLLDVGGDAGDLSIFSGLRVLVMDNDPGRADVLAQALRERRAQVAVTDVSIDGLERGERLDPEVIILDAAAIEGEGFEAVRSIRRNPRLRWASLLVARWDELWLRDAGVPDIEKLAGQIAPLTQHDHALRTRASKEASFDTRLELTGPSRLLRSLARASGTHHVTVRCPKATVEVDVSDGLLVGAQGTRHGAAAQPIEGLSAVAALMMLGAGRVRVEKRGHPSCANVMTPVDEALSAAGFEVPPVVPSAPPPSILDADDSIEETIPTSPGEPSPVAATAKNGGVGLRGPSKPDVHEVLGAPPSASRPRTGTMLGMAPIGRIQTVKTPPSGTDRDAVELGEAPKGPTPPDLRTSDHPTNPPTPAAGAGAPVDSYHPTAPPPKHGLDLTAPPTIRVPSPAALGVKVPPPASAAKPAGAAAAPKAPAASGAAKAPAPAPSPARPPAPAGAFAPKGPAAAPGAPGRARTMMGVGVVGTPAAPASPGPAPAPSALFTTRATGSGPALDEDFVDLGSGLMEVPSSLKPPTPPPGTPAGAGRRTSSPEFEEAPTDMPPPMLADELEVAGAEVVGTAAAPAVPSAPEPAPAPVAPVGAFGLPPTLTHVDEGAEVREDEPTTAYSTNRPWPSPEPRPSEVSAPPPEKSKARVVLVGLLVLVALVAGGVAVFVLTRGGEEVAPVAAATTPTAPAARAPEPTPAAAPAAPPTAEAAAEPTAAPTPEVAAEPTPAAAPEAPAADVIDPALRRLAERSPDDAAERAARQAQALIADGDLGAARAHIDFALEADAGSHYAWAAEARYALAQGNAAAALGWAEKAAQRRPRRSDYQVLRGDALAAQGNADAARAAYQRALELDRNDPEARARLAN